MASVLITAFEPYGEWQENASWLALVEMTRSLPAHPKITTRRYPVDLRGMKQCLEKDLQADYDLTIHLGQAPGANQIRLEAVGINIFRGDNGKTEETRPVEEEGPPAFACPLPLAIWAERIRGQGIPARVSHHAGVFLCNAAYYYARFLAVQRGLRTQSLFLHLPLAPCQVLDRDLPSMPSPLVAQAVFTILQSPGMNV